MHKFEVYVIDIDDNGAEELIEEIVGEYTAYDIRATHLETADIGEWDNHVLNDYTKQPVEEYRKYFKKS